MTVSSPVPARFFSYRTLFGWLAGILVVLIFTIFFNQPCLNTPAISLVLAIMLSKLSTPKHLAGLGALIGIPVGIIYGIWTTLQSMKEIDPAILQSAGPIGDALILMIVIYLLVSLAVLISIAYYTFLGFFFAQLIRLYKRGAIF
jgi:hypothetical protein